VVIYVDTSFLVSLYVDEPQSPLAQNYVEKVGGGLVFTPFHRLELRTALRLRVFRDEITTEFLKNTFRLLETDIRDGAFEHVPLNWNETLREAEEIGAAHVAQIGARSGDILHVASALVLDATEFCTFDQRQAELAKRAGLKVRAWRDKGA
jgi:predicted nucleic acid-binding protein